MPDRDNTYSTNQIRKMAQCHSSYGNKTRLASPKLDRWKDLNKAIVDWLNNNALEETSVKVANTPNFVPFLKDLENSKVTPSSPARYSP